MNFSEDILLRPGESGITYSKCRKRKSCQPRILYLAQLSFMHEEEIKAFLKTNKINKSLDKSAKTKREKTQIH